MAANRPELWGEATTDIDFGDGTKVRVGNTSITLKGRFFRDDNWMITSAQKFKKETQEQVALAAAALSAFHGEKYPYDIDKGLVERIENAARKYKHVESERQKLVDMVSSRDTTIRNLQTTQKELRSRLFTATKDAANLLFETIMESFK